jgi:hypothetical protein
MARMMRMSGFSWLSGDAAPQGRWGPGGAARNAGRRGWASTAMLVAGTLAVALTSYSLSLKVAGERRETERLARQNRALEDDLKALDAELRVRMRMPQLQRWNDDVLGLVPISATQYLTSPLHLANYGKPIETGLPKVQLAVRDLAPVPAPVQPRLVAADAVPARSAVIPVSAEAPPAAPAAPVRPAAEAPADLLQQVEMSFGPAAGADAPGN